MSLEDELPGKKKKQKSLWQLFREWVYPEAKFAQQKAPMTANVTIGVLLIFCYISALALTSAPSHYVLVLPLIATIYILLCWVQAERRREPGGIRKKHIPFSD